MSNAASKRYAIPLAAALHLAKLLRDAAEIGPVEREELVGQLGPYSVVRTGYHGVRLSDHEDPSVHSGHTLRVDQARELSDELRKAAANPETALRA
jgi:hypothetical protein